MRVFLTLLIAMFSFASLRAQTVPTGFQVDTLIGSGLTAPNDFCILPDGRILIAERGGKVLLFVEATGALTTVGIVPAVEVGSERGLLSIAYENGYLYTWSSRLNKSFMLLSRFTLTGDLNNSVSSNLNFLLNSERVIIDNAPDNTFTHNGGTLRFGPDGMLYLSVGDDDNCAQAQFVHDMMAVLLRMDVSQIPSGPGTTALASIVPTDNPFASATDINQRLVIAFGFRNPFSFCIDSLTGDLFIGDVGEISREEIDWYPRNLGGALPILNYGWPYREGLIGSSVCPGHVGNLPGLTDPIVDYARSTGLSAVMSAGVVRNLGKPYDFGASYEGRVFYTDYFNGEIRGLDFNTTTQSWQPAPAVPGQAGANFWGSGFAGASHFDSGPDGAIYFVQHQAPYDFNGGFLKRIRPQLSPQSTSIAIVSGADQVNTAGTAFKHPLIVRVIGSNGLPAPGETVVFQPSSNLAVAANSAVTDANGEVSVQVSSKVTGVFHYDGFVSCTTQKSAQAAKARFFGRELIIESITASPESFMIVKLSNITFGTAPVPFILAVSDLSVPMIATQFGDLHVDLVNFNQTLVLEDGSGFFGFTSYANQVPVGYPYRTIVYKIPVGPLNGLKLKAQAVWADQSVLTSQAGTLDSVFGFTNPFVFVIP